MTTTFLIIIGVLVFLALYAIGVYNGLIKSKNRVDESASDIDVQLKRRFDLIPNVIETVKGYAAHEKETFDMVVEARNKAMEAHSSGDPKREQEADNALSGTLKTLFALSEAYPELKANANFLDLQRELADTENKIQASRRFFNTNVREYNIKLEIFPSNIFANMLGFKKHGYYEIEDVKQRENVKVEF